jgi:hypothetical protein
LEIYTVVSVTGGFSRVKVLNWKKMRVISVERHLHQSDEMNLPAGDYEQYSGSNTSVYTLTND